MSVHPEIADEIRAELAHRDPIEEAKLAIQAAAAMATALRRATIAQTLATDWVIHEANTPDGDKAEFAYLQDCGCQRVANLWGIEFERTRLDDFQKEVLSSGHVVYSIMVTGRSTRTGLERTEIGTRSTSSSFFVRQWDKAQENDDESAMRQILLNVQKAALTNAHGRVTRAVTGMNRMPASELQMILGERGAKGVSRVDYKQQGGGPTEGQVKKIAGLACYEGKVEGYARKDYWTLVKLLKEQSELTKGRAGEVIEWLGGAQGKVAKADLLERCGVRAEGQAPAEPSEGATPASAKASAEKPYNPETDPCPICARDAAFVQSMGHAPNCSKRAAR
jgi:hypothetical protein